MDIRTAGRASSFHSDAGDGRLQLKNGVLTQEQITMGELWWSFKQSSKLDQYTPEQLNNATQWSVWSVDPNSGAGAGASFNPYAEGSIISVVSSLGVSTQETISQLAASPNVVAFYPLIEG